MKTLLSLGLILWFIPTVFAQTPVHEGRNYAVFFYVTNLQSGWAKLPETALEARQLKSELEGNFGFTGELVGGDHLDVLQ